MWWVVKINKYPHKLIQNSKQNRNITAFEPTIFDSYSYYFDDFTAYDRDGESDEDEIESNSDDEDKDNEDKDFIQQKYDWVDQLLEYKYITQQYT